MARTEDMARIRDELIDACKWGEEARARALVLELGETPEDVRAQLEAMLEGSDGLARQAAVFGLGELGGAANARRLEQQLLIEEAREDYDGEAVVEAIVDALGRMDEPGARKTLVQRLERLAGREPESPDIYALARALWRRRHPDLIPTLRRILEQGPLPEPNGLRGLLRLLEKSPGEIGEWARDPAVPVEDKQEVLVLLQEELPEPWISSLPAFLSTAKALVAQAMSQKDEAADYCERLFSVLLMHRDRTLSVLSAELRAELRHMARSLVASRSMGCALKAARMLGLVGRPEDVPELEAHHPADPTFAKVFDDAIQELRGLWKH